MSLAARQGRLDPSAYTGLGIIPVKGMRTELPWMIAGQCGLPSNRLYRLQSAGYAAALSETWIGCEAKVG